MSWDKPESSYLPFGPGDWDPNYRYKMYLLAYSLSILHYTAAHLTKICSILMYLDYFLVNYLYEILRIYPHIAFDYPAAPLSKYACFFDIFELFST